MTIRTVRRVVGSPDSRARAAARGVASWVVLCAALATARADEVDERAQDAIDALRGGDVARAVEVLDVAAVADALPARPDLVHVLCDRAYRCDGAAGEAPAALRRQLAATLLRAAESAHAAAPADVRGLWALSHALVLRERAGPPQGADAWLRAADLLEDAHERAPGDGEALGYAVTFLLEGAALEPDDQHALLKRGAAISRAAQRAHPESIALATTLASAHLWGSRSLLPSNRKGAKAALQAAFAQLSPHLDRDVPRADVSALWNDAVTLDAEAGFALRERYVTVPAFALGGALAFDVAVSPRWTVTTVPATDDAAAYVYVTQTDAAGATLRQILFRRYTWGFSYPFTGPNEVKGDNVKNLARGLRDISVERVFAPGAQVSEVRKSRVGRELVGHAFDVAGFTTGGERAPLTLHGWCLRGGHQASFGVLVYVYGEDGRIDVETEALLAGLREPED